MTPEDKEPHILAIDWTSSKDLLKMCNVVPKGIKDIVIGVVNCMKYKLVNTQCVCVIYVKDKNKLQDCIGNNSNRSIIFDMLVEAICEKVKMDLDVSDTIEVVDKSTTQYTGGDSVYLKFDFFIHAYKRIIFKKYNFFFYLRWRKNHGVSYS